MQDTAQRNTRRRRGLFSAKVETSMRRNRKEYPRPGRSGVIDTFCFPPRNEDLVEPAKAGAGASNVRWLRKKLFSNSMAENSKEASWQQQNSQ